MVSIISDNAIHLDNEDEFNVSPFAKSISNTIKSVHYPEGVVISLHGEWGSGKSSVVNLIKQHLNEDENGDVFGSNFNAWWLPDSQSLELAFLQHLTETVSQHLQAKDLTELKTTFRNISDSIRPFLAAGGSLVAGGSDAGSAAVNKTLNFLNGNTVEQYHKKASSLMEKTNKKYLLVIDDIDRLSPQEAMSVFKLVKTIGKLPNTIFLLVFDRSQVQTHIEQNFSATGSNYLEKIVQLSFDMPSIEPEYLRDAAWKRIVRAHGSDFDPHDNNFHNVFIDCVLPFLKTPRDVTRLFNALSALWPSIKNEVAYSDVIAMESIRLKNDKLWISIIEMFSTETNRVIQTKGAEQKIEMLAYLLKNKGTFDENIIETATKRLFPQLHKTEYSGFRNTWSKERRICIAEHMCTYIRRSQSPRSISFADENTFLDNLENGSNVKTTLRRAANSLDENGRSMVPKYLALVNQNLEKLTVSEITSAITSFFQIIDVLDIAKDGDRFFSNRAVITNLLMSKLDSLDDPAERRCIFENVIVETSVYDGYMLLQSSIDSKTKLPKQRSRNGELLIQEEHLNAHIFTLNDLVKNSPEILETDLVIPTLRSYIYFGGETDVARSITNKLFDNTVFLEHCSDSFMSYVNSWGSGELDDRVTSNYRELAVGNLSKYVEVDEFIAALKKNQSDDMTLNRNIFLSLWNKPNKP